VATKPAKPAEEEASPTGSLDANQVVVHNVTHTTNELNDRAPQLPDLAFLCFELVFALVNLAVDVVAAVLLGVLLGCVVVDLMGI
jgi:hypothetical protein